MRYSASVRTRLPCAKHSRMRWCAFGPAPKARSIARSAPICVNPARRLPRRCIRSFAQKGLGCRALRWAWASPPPEEGDVLSYDVVWNRTPDSSRSTIFSPSPLSVRPPLRANLSRNVRLSPRS